MLSSRIRPIPLFSGLRLVTSGVAGADNVYAYVDVNVPHLSQLVVGATALFFVAVQESFDTDKLQWNIELIPGYDRNREASAISISAADITNAAVPFRTSPYTTSTNFMLSARLRLRYRNKTGTSGVQTALVSATLLVTVDQ